MIWDCFFAWLDYTHTYIYVYIFGIDKIDISAILIKLTCRVYLWCYDDDLNIYGYWSVCIKEKEKELKT